MLYPLCGDRHDQHKPCNPASFARHRQNRQPRASSIEQAQQDARNISMNQIPDLATLHLGTGEQAPPSESSAKQTVPRAAMHKQGDRQAPQTGLTGNQPVHPSADIHASPAPERDATGQRAAYSWPRRTHAGESAFWSPSLPREGVQQPYRSVGYSRQSHCSIGSSRSVWTQRQDDGSAGGGQSSSPNGEPQLRLATTSGGQLRPADQGSRSRPGVEITPILGIESVTKTQTTELTSTDRAVGGYIMQFRIEAEITIAPMNEAQSTEGLWNSRASLERFMIHLSVAHNTQVPSQRARMGANLQFLSPELCPRDTWSLVMVDRVVPRIFTPRESTPVR
jgi:hypothetical protein